MINLALILAITFVSLAVTLGTVVFFIKKLSLYQKELRNDITKASQASQASQDNADKKVQQPKERKPRKKETKPRKPYKSRFEANNPDPSKYVNIKELNALIPEVNSTFVHWQIRLCRMGSDVNDFKRCFSQPDGKTTMIFIDYKQFEKWYEKYQNKKHDFQKNVL